MYSLNVGGPWIESSNRKGSLYSFIMNTSTKEQVEVPQVFSAITAAIMGKQKMLNLSAVFCKNIQVQHSMCGLYGSFLKINVNA